MIRLAINPLTWTNDDMPELGAETPLETCLAEARQAGFAGVELGNKFPREAAALTPILMVAGLWLPMILTGAVLVETTFAWPGLGWLMAESVGGRDYPVATACVLFGTGAVVLGSFVADLAQRLLDPRVAE